MDTPCDIALGDEDVQTFRQQGFLSVGRVVTGQELTWLRALYNAVVKQRKGYTLDEFNHNIGEVPPPPLIAIMSPEVTAPALKASPLLGKARQLVTRLLGVEDAQLLSGWRIFCKPAHGGETPWHQDAAYRPPPHHGASVWVPLDPATVESSCLSYIQRSHLEPLRPHHLHEDHLVAEGVDSSHAITCPVAAGEAIVHHCRTLHQAGPNTTDRPRRALVIVCQVNQ